MSPHLRKHPVEAVIERLRASGDAQAADVLTAMRDAVSAQDEALRDLVCDARDLSEVNDEDGSTVDIGCAQNGFDALLVAFGYGHERGYDRAEAERLRASGGEFDDYAGAVFLGPLDHLRARILTEGASAERNIADGAVAVEIPAPGGGREILYVDRAPPAAAPAP